MKWLGHGEGISSIDEVARVSISSTDKVSNTDIVVRAQAVLHDPRASEVLMKWRGHQQH